MGKLSELSSGYIGNVNSWRCFFKQLSGVPELADYVDVVLQKVFGEVGDDVSPLRGDAITNVDLPRSYRDFVLAGGIPFYNELVSRLGYNDDTAVPGEMIRGYVDVEAIFKFGDVESEYYDAYMNAQKGAFQRDDGGYYIYRSYRPGVKGYVASNVDFGNHVVNKYLRDTLVVGRLDLELRVLLNPHERTCDGELEAWRFDSCGANRYRSFAELFLNDICALIREIRKDYLSPVSIEMLREISADLLLDFDVVSARSS